MGSRYQITSPTVQLDSFFKIVIVFSLLQPKKLMASTKPSVKIDGFSRTHRTHANGATVFRRHSVALCHGKLTFGVFKQGMKKVIAFCLEINILKGNFVILYTERMASW